MRQFVRGGTFLAVYTIVLMIHTSSPARGIFARLMRNANPVNSLIPSNIPTNNARKVTLVADAKQTELNIREIYTTREI